MRHTIRLIGRSTLGEKGFSLVPSHLGDDFSEQFEKIRKIIPFGYSIAMTSITNTEVIKEGKGEYIPEIKLWSPQKHSNFNPVEIYKHCCEGDDIFYPFSDFIIWRCSGNTPVALTTFSREAPVLAFRSSNGSMALGTILRKSLTLHGDYLFRKIQQGLGEGKVQVILFTCNHFDYPDTGSIPLMVQSLAERHQMQYVPGCDSEQNSECYHQGEDFHNHVVAMW